VSLQIIAWIVIPLAIFVIGGTISGITLMIKGSAYMARSQMAQENTANSNQSIADNLQKYMTANDQRVQQNSTDIAVLKELILPRQNGRH
jgi:hypothetical protein